MYREADEIKDMEGLKKNDIKGLSDNDLNIEEVVMSAEEFRPIETRLLVAKAYVRSRFPDFAYILDNMRTILTRDKKKCPTMCVTPNGNIFINVDFMMNELNEKETAGVLVHEAAHIKNRTFPRRKGRNMLLWNYATDYRMNADILSSGLELPSFALIPKIINGDYYITDYGWEINIQDLDAEQIYAELKKKLDEIPQGPEPQKGPTNQEPDEPYQVGDIVKVKSTKKYYQITAINTNTGKVTVGSEIPKKEVGKYLDQGHKIHY